MDFVFETLFTIDFRHQYFGNSLFYGFTVTATDKTKSLMSGLDIGSRLLPGKLIVYYNTNFAGTKRTRADLLDKSLSLSFHAEITDRNFLNYTSIPSYSPSNNVIYFNNKKYLFKSQQSGKGYLHRDSFVSEKIYGLYLLQMKAGLKSLRFSLIFSLTIQ